MSDIDPIYLPYQTYEDGISNRERRALRGPTKYDRRTTARRTQAESGMRIRISRPVKNQQDFSQELKVWIPPVQEGLATRRSLGNLAITLFDTNQEPLQFCTAYTQDSLAEMLQARYPSLFKQSPPIEVTGTASFGSRSRPYIGLTLAPGSAYKEQAVVRRLVAPELALDDSHQLDHRPHVSLGQIFTTERAAEIRAQLASVIPAYVQFEPIEISVENCQ